MKFFLSKAIHPLIHQSSDTSSHPLALTIVDGKPLHEKRGEAGASASSERVENEEALEAGATVGGFADAVEDDVNQLFADGIVTASVVVRRILFA